jgi:hypothetical protein
MFSPLILLITVQHNVRFGVWTLCQGKIYSGLIKGEMYVTYRFIAFKARGLYFVRKPSPPFPEMFFLL